MRPRKRTVNCIVTALAVLLLLSCTQTTRRLLPSPPAYQDPAYERDIFYDALAPHGTWVTHRTYGRVWYPNNITRHWRPYTDGHWQYSAQYGWVWVADQEWGWAPFHYGRWVFDDWYGWVWIPGRVWAPAWVSWRYGGGHAAWAPMPPTAVWRPHHGIDHRFFRSERDLSWDSWVSIPESRLSDRDMHRHIIDRHHNRQILQKATTSSEIKLQNDHVVNEGVPVQTLEKVTGKKVAPAELIEVTRPDAQKGAMDSDGLKIFKPQLDPETNDDLRQESDRAEALARQLEDQQRQSGQAGTKEAVAEPRQPGRLTTDQAPEVNEQHQPAGAKGGGPTPAKDAVGDSDPFVEPPSKNAPPDSPALNASPAALPSADPKSAPTAPPPETQPLPRESEKKPVDQGGTKGSPQDTTNQGKPSPAAPPNQPTAPSTAHPHEAGVPEQQSAPHLPLAEDLPPKNGNPPSPKLNEGPAAPADGLKSNKVDHSPSAQDKPQHNDTTQQKNPPLTTREMGNSEPGPGGKGAERFEKTQTEEPPRGMPTRSPQGGDQGPSGSQIFPEQKNPSPRSRNDENRLGNEPGGLQPQTAPAADVTPQRMLEPTGHNRPMTPQDQQIKNSGDSPKGKKQSRKPGEPEEEEGEQGLPPK